MCFVFGLFGFLVRTLCMHASMFARSTAQTSALCEFNTQGPAMPFRRPRHGDRVLVLRWPWLSLILSRQKKLEVRARRLSPGRYFLGCSGHIWGHVEVGAGELCQTGRRWRALARSHRVPTALPPYQRTWVHPLAHPCRAPAAVPYSHPRGAIGLVIFRPAAHAANEATSA
jgi:hypothetical protein